MSKNYYETIGKDELLKNPSRYAWNCVLYYIQFTQDELLEVKDLCDIKDIIKYQKAITYNFLETHFTTEIDNSLDIDWNDVEYYLNNK